MPRPTEDYESLTRIRFTSIGLGSGQSASDFSAGGR